MSDEVEFTDVEPKATDCVPTAAQVTGGVPVPPVSILQIMSPDDWEAFTEEWLSYFKTIEEYQRIRRTTGAGDRGLDVIAFTSVQGFSEPWDSYQCKHYDHALEPNDIRAELGKIIYHSFRKTQPFNQTCRLPRKHVFVAPKGVGITVGRWLDDPDTFKEEIRRTWESHSVPKIGKGIVAPLEGELLKYFNEFDFTMFEDRTGIQLIEDHAKTVFYIPRFGGVFPPRNEPNDPPSDPVVGESIYLQKLLGAYGDKLGESLVDKDALSNHPYLEKHYNRQRVLFYSAESLRNFARDRTPPRTFDSLKDDVYHGVIDTCEEVYDDQLARLRATITAAGGLNISGNALVDVTRVADKQGICHQLANEDRLEWKDDDD